MHRSRLIICSTALLFAACAKKEAPKDTTAAMAPPRTRSGASADGLTRRRGRQVEGHDHSGRRKDSSTTTATIVATADTTGWTMDLPSGQKVPLQVKVSADTVLTKSAVYPSMRRKGKKVWTEAAFRVENGKLAGTTVAHYENSGADSVLTLRMEGTKAP